jgi:DNA-binding Lrp family transcriptional regulator
VLQEDMPLVTRPYTAMAASIGRSERELFDWAAGAQARGQLRRIAAVLHHRKAGFRANGMAVWKVPAERIDEVGNRMARFTSVSHCYQRPTYADWPYSVFSMIHARTVEDCELVANAIARETGIDERAMLYSSTEFRKIRLRYFTKDLDEWESRHLSCPGNARASTTPTTRRAPAARKTRAASRRVAPVVHTSSTRITF